MAVTDASSNLPASLLPPSVVAAEKRALAFLADGKWRAARDEIKPLVKVERGRFLPILIAANVGLIREMAQKGRVAEARQMLAYLATIAPADQVRAMEAEIAVSTNPAATPAASLDLLAVPGNALPEVERVRLADRAVVAFEPAPAGNPALAALAAELAVIHASLAQVSAGGWEGLAEKLRAVPRRSPFSHWALFIKGLAAFYTGDTDRAVQCFAGLPPNSVPAKASQPYLVLAGRLEPEVQLPQGAAWLDAVGRVLGQPWAGRLLCRAELLWKSARHAESYRVFREGASLFPTDTQDWLGALSEFYFQAHRSMNDDQLDDYLGYFVELLLRAGKNPTEDMLGHRMLALMAIRDGEWSIAPEQWAKFLAARAKVRHPNPKLEAVAYCWLGEKLAEPMPEGSAAQHLEGFPRMRSPARGRDYFQKAIDLDPDLLPAYLRLSQVYAALRQTRERNRLLDEMTRRFPAEKAVLLQAADRCRERKTFPKALDLLERARNLDRLDPLIPAMIVLCRRQFAWKHFAQGQPDKARQILAGAEEFLSDKPDDFQTSRWTFAARHGLQEQLFGDAAVGERLLVQARAASPFTAAFLLFAQLAYRRYAPRAAKDTPYYGALRSELKTGATAARAAQLLRQMDFWAHAPDAPKLEAEYRLVRGYVAAAAKPACSREEAKMVVELCLASSSQGEARLFIKAALRRDRDDPLFRLYDHSLRTAWDGPQPRHRRDLEEILALAQSRRDEEAIQRVQRALRTLDHPAPLPPMPGMDWADEDDEDTDDWEGPEDDLLPPMPAQLEAEMTILMAALRHASPAEIKELRRTAAKDIPPFMLDMLIEAAKTGRPLPPFPPPPDRRHRSGPAPSQRELF